MSEDARDEVFREQAAAHGRREARESEQAQVILDGFVRAAAEQGLTARPLRATSYNGRATYRTGIVGWYLSRDRSNGVDQAGRFYVLNTPGGLSARLRGVELQPTPPPLAIGKGARDGESMSLKELVERRLAAGEAWV
jgi:hypothetical protein